MVDATQDHWEQVYLANTPEEVSWFQKNPALSLAMIAAAGVGHSAAIVDVGGGASTLVDRLIEKGFRKISVLDVSSQALAKARARLGARAAAVNWLVADVGAWSPPIGGFDLWHDRALFHFLVTEADRQAYLQALNQGLRGGGYAIIATFALTGPERCSGLPVQRYSRQTLQATLGAGFQLIKASPETHITPRGLRQDFICCLFRKVES